MKILAVLLSLGLAAPSARGLPVQADYPNPPTATPLDVSRSSAPVAALEPFVITAPPLHEETAVRERRLKSARNAGGAAAVSGAGLMAYAALAAGTGPIGWAAGLMFFGGMTAYLSHRKLAGNDDFGPTNAVAPSAAMR